VQGALRPERRGPVGRPPLGLLGLVVGQDDPLAGEAVLQGVAARGGLALLGAGAGRLPGGQSVGGGLADGGHRGSLSVSVAAWVPCRPTPRAPPLSVTIERTGPRVLEFLQFFFHPGTAAGRVQGRGQERRGSGRRSAAASSSSGSPG